MRTLVVHAGGIGDFLLACPAIASLCGPVEIVGYKARAELAVAGGIAEAAHDIDAVDFHTAYSTPSDRLRGFLAPFDRAVVWMGDDGFLRDALLGCGVKSVETYLGLPPRDWKRHASAYFLDCVGARESAPWRLDMEPSDVRHDIVLHPGSGGRDKIWPVEHWEELTEILHQRGRRVTWCLGPAEEDINLSTDSPVLRADSLVVLASALASASWYVGNDSGITHLAAAVGCNTTAIFGPTEPAVWAPLGAHVHVVQGSPWPSVAAVSATIGPR
jgi:hypothetical protein